MTIIGGPTTDDRNIISGNNNHGIFLSGVTQCKIQGNYIGTDPSGTAARRNLSDGIRLKAAFDNLIGGSALTPADPPGNLISGNNERGISIGYAKTDHHKCQRTLI